MAQETDADLRRRMGQQMQRLRLRENLTQFEAAAKVSMHGNQWAKYERGEKSLPLRYVQAIESTFHMTFDLTAPKVTKGPSHSPEYYKGMLEAGRRLSAAGQQIMEEATDGLTAAATTPAADRLAAAAGAAAMHQASGLSKGQKGPRTRHRAG